MDFKTFYNEVVTDHNMHPLHKHPVENPDIEMEGVNPSCGDEITVLRHASAPARPHGGRSFSCVFGADKLCFTAFFAVHHVLFAFFAF